ncbi:MAG: alcohol dehydrogenase [Thaumarchaeota archaeon]|nr:alcohol dehydrogenase [Nitrososphaerota archaeon]
MRLVEYGTPLRLEEVDAPRAGNGVLVKVVAAGVCHTDLHVISGSYDLGNGNLLKMADRGIRLPITPGHEIAGEVADLGVYGGKTAIQEGERVVVYPWLGCGTCRKCIAGYENLCEDKPASLGIFRDGGYAEYVFVPHPRYLIPAAGLRAEEAAPLACSGLTSYSALNKCRLESEELLVIIGAGGLGTTAIQLANRTTGAKVVVLDIDDSKLALASSLGANQTINTSGLERKAVIEAVKKENGGRGADAVIDFVGNPETSGLGFELLTKQGRLVLVGLFGGAGTFSLPLFPLKGAQVVGSFTGTLTELSELVQLAANGVVKPVISARYKLDEANEVLGRLGRGEISGRAILRPY